jgi:hypothetical protein
VLELWDQRPIRLAVSALAAVVLVVGLVAFVRSRESKPVAYAPAPSETQILKARLDARYGAKIPLPPEAEHVTRSLIREGILRQDPLAARQLVSDRLSAAATDRQWAQGTLPLPEFPLKEFGGASFKVMRSRARDVLLDVSIATTDPSRAQAIQVLVELARINGRWVVIGAAPPSNAGVPSAP